MHHQRKASERRVLNGRQLLLSVAVGFEFVIDELFVVDVCVCVLARKTLIVWRWFVCEKKGCFFQAMEWSVVFQ